ncbi:hypothetical protein BDV93DRAFT_603632 [Ceratobasidium sp. AG-I]|nr:hypothetical protein BDV93DRAFT_603632 [Ceratobasidium sp. AG-I]
MVMPRCRDGDSCRRMSCKFTHPYDPDYSIAKETRYGVKGRDSGAPPTRDGGYGSRSRGGSGWDDAGPSRSTATSGWGDPPPTHSRFKSSETASGGWGTSPPRTSATRGASSSGGDIPTSSNAWRDPSPAGGGWGSGSPLPTKWARSESPAGASGGWGIPEPSSRRTSASHDRPISPTKPAPSSPRAKPKSPVRAPPSAPRDWDQERDKERDRDRDRDSRRERDAGGSSPSRQSHSRHRSPPSEKGSSHSVRDRDRESHRSPNKRRESIDSANAMDIDLPPTSLSSSKPKDASATASKPTSSTGPTTPMPPPPLPLGAIPPMPLGHVPSPLGLVPPPGQAPPPVNRPPPPPANVPPALPPPPPPPPPAAAAKAPLPPPILLPAPSPVPTPAPKVPPSPVMKDKETPTVGQPEGWIGLLDTLLKQRHTYEVRKKQVAYLEQKEKAQVNRAAAGARAGQPVNEAGVSLVAARDMADRTRKEMEAVSERFAASMALLNVPANPPTAAREPTPAPAMVGGTALPNKEVEEMMSLARSLANEISKLQSELRLVEAETEGISGLRKDVEKVKEEARDLKEDVKKEGETRAREVGEVKKEAVVAKLQAGTAKNEVEAARKVAEAVQKELAGANIEETQRVLGELRHGLEQMVQEQGEFVGQLGEVRQGIGGVRQEIEEVKQEIGRLKKEAEERSAATASGKRNRNQETPTGDGMDVDDASRPAKRTRLDESAQPPPLSASQSAPTLLAPPPAAEPTTPTPSSTGLSHRKLEERIVTLEEYVTDMENQYIQLGTDVREQLEEFAEHIGLDPDNLPGGMARGASASDVGDATARSESAPPKLSPRSSRVAGTRSSAPPAVSPTRANFPESPLQTVAEASEVAAASASVTQVNGVLGEEDVYDSLSGLRSDLGNTQLQILKLWRGEGEWPAAVARNLNAALGVKSIEEVWTKAAEVARASYQDMDKTMNQPRTNGAKAVNGHTVHGHMEEDEPGDSESETLILVKSLKEEMREMRERMERSEKERDALRAQQAEQHKILLHVQSVIETLPKPGNEYLSQEYLLKDTVQHGTSPAQADLAALRQLASVIPSLLHLAGISAEN